MLHIILFIIAGILVGYVLRNQHFVQYIGTILSLIIMLLLFFLGVSVGSNEQVVSNFSQIGLDAFILTVGATLGSVFCARWIYVSFFKNGNNDK